MNVLYGDNEIRSWHLLLAHLNIV